jgi:O-antigen/teichoic acid export membrane protein
MGSLQRMLKNLGAMFAGRAISLISQFIVPPIFIYRYSVASYGEWIALSSAIAALFTLSFGVQTYVNQDLAIRAQRGEMDDYRVRQSTALRLLLGVVIVAAIGCLSFFFIPFDSILHLHLSRRAAQLTLYLLAIQILMVIVNGYLSGIFLSVQLAHRGANWNNVQMFGQSLGLLVGVLLHAPFPVLAGIQASALVLTAMLILIDLRYKASSVFPSVRYFDRSAVKDIVHGSGYFALIEWSTFLTYSAPLLVMQRFIGPVAVAGFGLMRILFSSCRQLLAMFTQSMSSEITGIYGRGDWISLARLYDVSERIVFFLIAVVNTGVLMLSPVLITLWVHKKAAAGQMHHVSDLFAISPYVLSAAISMVISLKEHKSQFQFSTNTHVELGKVMFFSYLAMTFVSFGTIHWFGVSGFLWTWLVTEAMQTVRLIRLNAGLFAHMEKLDTIYITRLVVLCGTALALTFAALTRTTTLPLTLQASLAVGWAGVIALIAWKLFRVREVSTSLAKLTQRFRT